MRTAHSFNVIWGKVMNAHFKSVDTVVHVCNDLSVLFTGSVRVLIMGKCSLFVLDIFAIMTELSWTKLLQDK